MTQAITIFSDFGSPYCYLAERSLRRLGEGVASIRYRAAPVSERPLEIEPEPWDALTAAAGEEGIDLRQQPVPLRTGKAHEAALFARALGREDALRDAVFAAFWRDGTDIGRIDVLCQIAASIGLDGEELKIALDIDTHADAVAADARLASRLGIVEPPVTYFGEGAAATIVTGAYTSDQLQTLLRNVGAHTGGR